MLSIEREPAVAGTFYSSEPRELIKQLKDCFDEFDSKTLNNISALIVPHAGYAYSGRVAASAYALIAQDAEYDNVFIIGSSHHVAFHGASVYNKGHYKTPLGVVPVNISLANDLIGKSKDVIFNNAAHSEEHTIEVQLPFLQYRMRHLNHIVPIVIGVKDYESCRSIAEVLRPYFNEKNLFVFSTDFSHYPADKEARLIDEKTGDVICKNDAQRLIDHIEVTKTSPIQNLYTGLCGWSSVLTLMYLTEGDKCFSYEKIKYMTSAEAERKDKSRVVGYQSILIRNEQLNGYFLSEDSKQLLLNVAHDAIYKHLGVDERFNEEENITELHDLCSAFVSVYVKGDLRGCIGRFSSNKYFLTLIADLSIESAFNDARFSPIEEKELDDLSIEISVLTPMRKISDIDEIELGKHGVFVKKDDKKGTYLPQVAEKTGWSLEELLGHLARDKAHIGWDGWRSAELFVFEAIIFSD